MADTEAPNQKIELSWKEVSTKQDIASADVLDRRREKSDLVSMAASVGVRVMGIGFHRGNDRSLGSFKPQGQSTDAGK